MLLMPEMLNDPEEDKYDEQWKVIISSGGEYILSKMQALVLMQAMARREKVVVFKSFIISIPFVAEFYREKRFLRGAVQLPDRATEKPFEPIPEERWQEIKRQVYEKIGRTDGHIKKQVQNAS